MKGLPVIEDFVAIVDDVGSGAHVPQKSKSHERKKPPQPFVAFFLRLLRLVQLRVRLRWRRIRRLGASLSHGGEGHYDFEMKMDWNFFFFFFFLTLNTLFQGIQNFSPKHCLPRKANSSLLSLLCLYFLFLFFLLLLI